MSQGRTSRIVKVRRCCPFLSKGTRVRANFKRDFPSTRFLQLVRDVARESSGSFKSSNLVSDFHRVVQPRTDRQIRSRLTHRSSFCILLCFVFSKKSPSRLRHPLSRTLGILESPFLLLFFPCKIADS